MSSPLPYVAHADGGSRGNPGPAGYGAVIRERVSGRVLAQRSDFIGEATNNVAEYRGLIAALEAARELGLDELEVRMDSKLVVEQMSGRWKIKNAALQTLAITARRLLDQFARVELTWVPRAENADADRLANEAMDTGHGSSTSAPAVTAAPPEPNEDSAHSQSLLTTNPGPAPALSLILLRHGETNQSLERRFSGRTDLSLTSKGAAQAEAAAQRIATTGDVAAIYSSPLARAQQTAQALAARLDLPVQVDDDLREIDFGEWEGLTFAEARAAGGDRFAEWAANPEIAPPGGESQAACLARISAARDRIMQRHDGARVIAVSHVTPIKGLLGDALGSLAASSRINLDLCSLSRIDYFTERAVIKLVNEVSHLGAL